VKTVREESEDNGGKDPLRFGVVEVLQVAP